MHANASRDEIAAFLDELLDAPRYRASEPDGNGLLYAGSEGVSKFAVAVNTSLTTIVGAAKAGAQLLVVHHPTWQAVDHELYDEKLAMLEQAQLSLYAAHASLDCAPEFGNAWALASELGIEVEETFVEYHGGHAGVIGRTHGVVAEFIQRASQALGVQVEAHAHATSFGRIAIVPGGGGNTADLAEARRRGCDTYLTGEGSMFTRGYAREAGMNLIFGTHHATEAPGIKALGRRIELQAQIPFEFMADSPDVF
jgi:dinuclear metal center YbgI/SA1388 family protein